MQDNYDPAVSLVEELDDQDLAGPLGDQSGAGLFTFFWMNYGRVCTLSAECSVTHIPCGW
jgi:hypothetical protein